MSIRRFPLDALLLVSLFMVLLPGAGLVLLDLIPLKPQLDFATYYLAAQALNAGRSPYDATVIEGLAQQAGVPHAAYLYPPLFAAVLRPLALLPFPLANALWLIFNLALFLLGVLLLSRLLALPRRWLPLLLLGSLLVPALHHTLELG
ncbi:DUF2029 domain-containing protein [Candidatus Gracilibacteria bacterium]|nr:DUF2029 domain-containing protein [Candidatus Gracilibacteria bacterium]